MLEPRLTHDVNVTGTLEVALAAGRAGVRRIVFAGSSAVYGSAPILPRVEDQLPDPQSPYAAGKLFGEHILRVLGAALGFETVVLRYFNIFGAGQDPNSDYAAVVPRFVTAGLRGERPIVYGDGLQSRDFTHVDNVVSANLLASQAPGAGGAVCNIGCGGRYSLLELLTAIGDALGTPLDPAFEPARQGDVPHSQADIGAASDRLGYRVLVPFAEGIARTVAWYREQAAARPGG
jgi:UDP-glucose 4-epimerase